MNTLDSTDSNIRAGAWEPKPPTVSKADREALHKAAAQAAELGELATHYSETSVRSRVKSARSALHGATSAEEFHSIVAAAIPDIVLLDANERAYIKSASKHLVGKTDPSVRHIIRKVAEDCATQARTAAQSQREKDQAEHEAVGVAYSGDNAIVSGLDRRAAEFDGLANASPGAFIRHFNL